MSDPETPHDETTAKDGSSIPDGFFEHPDTKKCINIINHAANSLVLLAAHEDPKAPMSLSEVVRFVKDHAETVMFLVSSGFWAGVQYGRDTPNGTTPYHALRPHSDYVKGHERLVTEMYR